MTMKTLFPILLAVCGGVLYHVGQKAVPRQVNPFVAIALAYTAGIVCCLVAMALDPAARASVASFKAANWAVFLLGLGAVIIEFGFLLAYRAGWNISTASVITNISVALILLPIGLLVFKEQLSWRNAAGVACCLLGLYLLAQK
jgi:drug/metabolite transporter (DMT)-like permease